MMQNKGFLKHGFCKLKSLKSVGLKMQIGLMRSVNLAEKYLVVLAIILKSVKVTLKMQFKHTMIVYLRNQNMLKHSYLLLDSSKAQVTMINAYYNVIKF